MSEAGTEADRRRAWLLHYLRTGTPPHNRGLGLDGFIVNYRRWRYEVAR